MKTMIRIYSTPSCPYCKELKDILTNDNIEFVDVNVNLKENEEEYKKLVELTKSNDVPIVKVGKRVLIPNISFTSIKQAGELTMKFLSES
jgi:glutaredoxin 3